MIAIWLGDLALGISYGAMVIGVYLTFKLLDIPDLTIDGSYALGGAVTALFAVNHLNPLYSMLCVLLFGMLAGAVTGLLATKVKINAILSGVLVSIALYTINIRIMGQPNLPFFNSTTMFTMFTDMGLSRELAALILFGCVTLLIAFLAVFFLQSEFGLTLRTVGENRAMATAQGIDSDAYIIFGLALSNGLIALSGSLLAQYQGFSDVNMGIGMILIGIASFIIGESLLRPSTIIWCVTASIIGGIIYRLIVTTAIYINIDPADMKLATALIVIAAFAIPRWKEMGGLFSHFRNKHAALEEGE